MARHPRTIWKPDHIIHSLSDTNAPEVAFFSTIRSVDADASQGLQLKRLKTTITFGLDSTNNNNVDRFSAHMGYFKWPADAVSPTITTIDLKNRTSIFSRVPVTLVGVQQRTFRLTAKTVRLTLGEEIFFFIQKLQESSTDVIMNTSAITEWWETQA